MQITTILRFLTMLANIPVQAVVFFISYRNYQQKVWRRKQFTSSHKHLLAMVLIQLLLQAERKKHSKALKLHTFVELHCHSRKLELLNYENNAPSSYN
jgi:hypothetical protein